MSEMLHDVGLDVDVCVVSEQEQRRFFVSRGIQHLAGLVTADQLAAGSRRC